MKYRAECLAGQCADGDVVRTFDTRADRNEWERAHREATGHTMIGYDWREPERRRYPVPPVVLASSPLACGSRSRPESSPPRRRRLWRSRPSRIVGTTT
jgi:hypothetical protein